MEEARISQLPLAGENTGDEDAVLVQSGTTVRSKARNISKVGYQDIENIDGNFTLALSHIGTYMRSVSPTVSTCTVPQDGSVAFPIGTTLNGVQASGAKLTINPEAGVTVNRPDGTLAATRGQGSPYALVKVGANTWDLFGDLEIA